MKIQLRYFASLREAVGKSQELLDVPPGVTTIADVRTLLQQRGGAWASALANTASLRVAYDQTITVEDMLIADGGEVAFFPPVTGG